MVRKSGLNPFYPLVILTGVAFMVTTLAYVVAWVRLMQPADASLGTTEIGPVLRFFNDRGEWLMVGEVIVLSLVAILAIALDQWRSRQTSSNGKTPTPRDPRS